MGFRDSEEENSENIGENPVDEENNYLEESHSTGEPLTDKESIVNNIFNTKNRIELLRHRLRGDVEHKGFWRSTKNSLAPESFINKQLASMEAVIDTVNSFSKKTDTETKKILHEAVRAFIIDMGNCEDIQVQDERTLAKMFEHSLELFLGLVEYGHGANVLRDVSAGLNTQTEDKNKKGFKEWVNNW